MLNDLAKLIKIGCFCFKFSKRFSENGKIVIDYVIIDGKPLPFGHFDHCL